MEKFRGVSGIYRFTNPEGLVYIGQSMDILKRFYSHKSGGACGAKLKESFKTHGFDFHKFELLEECDKSILLQRERFYINLYDSTNKGLNVRGNNKEKIISNNERNAGRKKKYKVETKLLRVPIPILDKINELAKPYENIKNNRNL